MLLFFFFLLSDPVHSSTGSLLSELRLITNQNCQTGTCIHCNEPGSNMTPKALEQKSNSQHPHEDSGSLRVWPQGSQVSFLISPSLFFYMLYKWILQLVPSWIKVLSDQCAADKLSPTAKWHTVNFNYSYPWKSKDPQTYCILHSPNTNQKSGFN